MILLRRHRQHTRKLTNLKLTQIFVLNCNFRGKQFMEDEPLVIKLWTI